jgi:hypothetical protein
VQVHVNGSRSRFIGYPDAIRTIQRLNPVLMSNNAGLKQAIGSIDRDSIDIFTAV